MKVNSVVSAQGWSAAAGTGRLQGRSTHDQATGTAPAAEHPAAPSSAPSTSDGQTERQKGVLRLLQEGHFQGVADVRLRINHAEAIAALDRNPVHLSPQERLRQMLETISSIFDEWVAAEGAASDTATGALQALATFSESVQQAAGASTGEGRALAVELRAAFEGLMQAIQTLFGSSGADESEGGADAADAQALAEKVQVTFQKAVEGLESAPKPEAALPELSEPKGRGGAYDKFLAAYSGTGSAETSSALRLVI